VIEHHKPSSHPDHFGLLARKDFLSKLSNEWISPVDQNQASHFDGARVMRYHHRKKIAVRVIGPGRRGHLFVHFVYRR
jgi:hypothetical protein